MFYFLYLQDMLSYQKTSLRKFLRGLWQNKSGEIWGFSNHKDGYITWDTDQVNSFKTTCNGFRNEKQSKTAYCLLLVSDYVSNLPFLRIAVTSKCLEWSRNLSAIVTVLAMFLLNCVTNFVGTSQIQHT